MQHKYYDSFLDETANFLNLQCCNSYRPYLKICHGFIVNAFELARCSPIFECVGDTCQVNIDQDIMSYKCLCNSLDQARIEVSVLILFPS